MKSKRAKVGLIGTIVVALCCFTPILVWLLTALGMTVLIGMLDIVLLPLLGVFIVVFLWGLIAN